MLTFKELSNLVFSAQTSHTTHSSMCSYFCFQIYIEMKKGKHIGKLGKKTNPLHEPMKKCTQVLKWWDAQVYESATVATLRRRTEPSRCQFVVVSLCFFCSLCINYKNKQQHVPLGIICPKRFRRARLVWYTLWTNWLLKNVPKTSVSIY